MELWRQTIGSLKQASRCHLTGPLGNEPHFHVLSVGPYGVPLYSIANREVVQNPQYQNRL